MEDIYGLGWVIGQSYRIWTGDVDTVLGYEDGWVMVRDHATGEVRRHLTSCDSQPLIESTVGIPTLNVWGTDKALIDPDEYCPDCEQDTRLGHYSNCPALIEADIAGYDIDEPLIGYDS